MKLIIDADARTLVIEEAGRSRILDLYSREAFELHKMRYDQIPAELVRYGSLMSIKGLAEKAPEHACRLAATLAFANDPKVIELYLGTLAGSHH